ncbi:RagB/SusD family nutrient uptake outer membrane protein [Zobellia russellii]|uniref:RagB/SusD family nutrient uptake outer membrane protein n=1 Tax=Zobellia russellii TaxID=248907 RepID=UPI001BFF01CB|nr:RagB/SusD family nutrient uptake outer membrane protein [Zobellia russellii]MBT9188265.1 RagB/SusD family nutrient uptake outer membrane protein [Zobellia russellii]
MKKYNSIRKSTNILHIVLILFFSSCSDEFLDITPNHYLTEGNFYQTEEDIDQAVLGVYGSLQDYVLSAHFLEEGRSDNTMYDNLLDQGSLGGGRQYGFLDQFKMTSDAGPVADAWNGIYSAIKDCNVTLENLSKADIDPVLAQRSEAELRFFRAFYHFVAVRYWGDVPLLLAPINSAEEAFALQRNPISEVYGAIIEDAEFAISNLPQNYSGDDIGRVTQGAARMLLAKVYLTRKDYSNTVQQLNTIVSSNQYSLLTDYAAIFDPANKNHNESIFEIQFKEGFEGESSNFIYQFAPVGSRGVVFLGPESGPGRNIPTTDMVEAYEPNDLRKDISVAYFDRNPSPLYYINKYNHDTDPDFSRTPNNWPLYRYADVLLMLAEAINEQSYQTGTPFNLLNMVRTRAGLGELTSTDLPDQESFRNAIAQERRVELAFENHRWFDLLRTDKAIETITAFGIKEKANPTLTPPDFIAYGAESFAITQEKLLYPIPNNELDLNPNLTQNPGY